MGTIIMIGQLLLALAILVTLHELGHFLTARMFGIKVEKFYLFFDAWGFKLFSIKKGDTEYGIGWLPLGGYVKIAGMIDESMDTEQLKTEPQPWEFRSKPAWQRLIVMLGGVIVNFVLGIIIFAGMLFYYGDQFLPNKAVNEAHGIVALPLGKQVGFQDGDKILKINGQELVRFDEAFNPDVMLQNNASYEVQRADGSTANIVLPSDFVDQFSTLGKDSGFIAIRYAFSIGEIQDGSEAKRCGLKKGDKILTTNGAPSTFFHEFEAAKRQSDELKMTVLRGDDTLNLTATLGKDKILGFQPDFYAYTDKYETVKYGFFESFPKGLERGVNTLKTQITAFGKMFRGELDPTKSLMGPIQMAKVFGAQWIWEKFWNLTGLISLILAFMNLLPIPALDGGHALFLIVEMIIRRPLSDKFMQVMQVIGMVILIGLMIFVFGNDLFQVLR